MPGLSRLSEVSQRAGARVGARPLHQPTTDFSGSFMSPFIASCPQSGKQIITKEITGGIMTCAIIAFPFNGLFPIDSVFAAHLRWTFASTSGGWRSNPIAIPYELLHFHLKQQPAQKKTHDNWAQTNDSYYSSVYGFTLLWVRP